MFTSHSCCLSQPHCQPRTAEGCYLSISSTFPCKSLGSTPPPPQPCPQQLRTVQTWSPNYHKIGTPGVWHSSVPWKQSSVLQDHPPAHSSYCSESGSTSLFLSSIILGGHPLPFFSWKCGCGPPRRATETPAIMVKLCSRSWSELAVRSSCMFLKDAAAEARLIWPSRLCPGPAAMT